MEETKPANDRSLERYSFNTEKKGEMTKENAKRRKILLYTITGLIILSGIGIGGFLLSDPVNLHNSKIVQYIVETNDNLSADLEEWSQLTPEPVSWKSLELKSNEIHDTVVQYILHIDDYYATPGKEYTIQQEYKSYLMDVAEQMQYSEKICLSHEKQKYDDESFYLDEVVVYMRRAHDHLNTLNAYLEEENIHLKG